MESETRWPRALLAVFTILLFSAIAAASARSQTFQGSIEAIDAKTHTFTVRTSKPGDTSEMEFHVNPRSELYIDGDRVPFGNLVKGDEVTVTYYNEGSKITVRHAPRDKKTSGK